MINFINIAVVLVRNSINPFSEVEFVKVIGPN